MGDLVRLAYFPFLPEAREAVREAGAGPLDILSSPIYAGVRRRAAARVEGALGDGIPAPAITDERGAMHELLSVPVARMLVVALGERGLVPRYAAAEARLAGMALQSSTAPEDLAQGLAATGIPAQPDDGAGGSWRLHVTDYLRHAPHDTGWKLVLRPVGAGHVRLGAAEMARLVEEAVARRVREELEAEMKRPLPEELRLALAPLAEQVKPRLDEAREAWSEGDFGPVQPGFFPPCMKELFAMMQRGENVPHHGRFAFATFLGTVGWNAEQIMDYMATLPNFDREKSRYQIEHVTGQRGVEKYTPPGCATMQTNGVCPLDRRDGLCFKVKHPLSYYRAKLRFQRQDAARAGALPTASAAPTSPPTPPPTPAAKEGDW